jgi:dynein heavy chain
MSILDDVQNPNSTINDSIIGLLQEKKQPIKKSIRKPKKKANQ